MSMMRCVSIWQPWAWLIAHGHKPIENRSWRIDYRGPLVIHAGKAHGKEQLDDEMWIQHNFPDIKMPPLRQMPFGAIVGIVDVIDCVTEHDSPWFRGPYGWVLTNARPTRVVKLVGRQGLFPVASHLVVPA